MTGEGKRRHVFISHHHKDDEQVQKLQDMLNRKGYDVRNSSIRVKPENQKRLEQRRVSDETIRRLLRRKISWAGTAIVLIGKDTHSRPWVNWEITQAAIQGKRIVGVFVRGGTNNDVPQAFEKYGTALKAWSTEGIMRAVDGLDNSFENPDGSPRTPTHTAVTVEC
jgi:hypothetical protein